MGARLFGIRRPRPIPKRLLVILIVMLVVLVAGSISTLSVLNEAPAKQHPSAQAAHPSAPTSPPTEPGTVASKGTKPRGSASTLLKPIVRRPTSPPHHHGPPPSKRIIPEPGPGCGLAEAAFCDTFAEGPTVNPANSREGGLSSVVWGVSQTTGNQNFGSSANDWASAQTSTCGRTGMVNPPDDVQVCDGQLVDTVNDGGTVTSLAMYPKQPFDFAGRTGTIVFDVNDNSEGSHSAWPELWVTDQPVPDPFVHEGNGNNPRNGFGIRFAGCVGPNNTCNGEGAPDTVTVDSAVTVDNYVLNDSFFGGSLKVDDLGSVTESGPGQMNHFEVRVSQNQIDVYGTNAFSGTLNLAATPLVHIATIPNVNLSFTRGLIWLEDAHYNGDKFNNQRLHTFTWSDVGFDGPALPRDLGFDVPDNDVPDNSTQAGPSVPAVDTGYWIPGGSSRSFTVPGITSAIIAAATDGLLTFNYVTPSRTPITLTALVNGNRITVPGDSETMAVSVPLSDLRAGDNTVTFAGAPSGMNVMNISLILQGTGGPGGVVPP